MNTLKCFLVLISRVAGTFSCLFFSICVCIPLKFCRFRLRERYAKMKDRSTWKYSRFFRLPEVNWINKYSLVLWPKATAELQSQGCLHIMMNPPFIQPIESAFSQSKYLMKDCCHLKLDGYFQGPHHPRADLQKNKVQTWPPDWECLLHIRQTWNKFKMT